MGKLGIELKTGVVPEGGEDKRTVYRGYVSREVDSTFLDDKWTRKKHGHGAQPLYFALYLNEGDLLDVVKEYRKFRDESGARTAKVSVADFLNELRKNYFKMMPDTKFGYVFSLVQRDKRLFMRRSSEVTHRKIGSSTATL